MGLSVEVVRKPPKPVPEEVAKIWAEQWAKEGREVDWQRLMPPRGYVALPRRWVVERTFSWLSQNRRMSKDYERLCASAEAFVYAAMIRLMVRRLARDREFPNSLGRRVLGSSPYPSPNFARPKA
jgi:hypothetical protein